jgi:glutaredoxin
MQSGSTATSSSASATPVTGTVYYYGAECPHCKVVNEFLEKEKIAEKVQFVKKEVWHDKTNQTEMMQAAKQCNLDTKSLGVPFLFDNGTCYTGKPDVKKLFHDKAGIKE